MSDLAGPHCRAVVIGTGQHPEGAALHDLPSAVRSACDLATVLSAVCGMAEDRIDLMVDPATAAEVLATVDSAARRAEGGVLLVFFAGHGLLGPGDQLYLATAAVTGPGDTAHAVPYTEIRNRLSEAPLRPVVVLDCCLSGLADVPERASRADPYATARPDGSFLLASAMHYAASFAPEGERHTTFTGELLRLLREGDPGAPRWFRLTDLYRHLDRRFQGTPARPHASSTGRIGDLRVARNAHAAAVIPEQDAAEDLSNADSDSPYPGMRPYLPDQSHLFHGREQLTRDLVARLRQPGPVVLVGPSGVGKSSLLRAGLCPAADEAGLGPVLLLEGLGERPFRTLAQRWADAVDRPFHEVERALGEGRFVPPAGAAARRPGVLVVDQAEEAFTLCTDLEERALFTRALAGGTEGDAEDADGRAGTPHIVIGMRADHYEHCLRDETLAPLVQQGQFNVPAMTQEELRRAIEGPARQAGLTLEDGLADVLLRDLGQARTGRQDAVALPFLAHALQETWARRRRGRLTFAGYYATGGLWASVSHSANAIHDSLPADEQPALRELLLRLVQVVDRSGSIVRRRVPLSDLDHGVELLGRLAEARLVVLDDEHAQLSHDALLHAWPLLREWIDEDLAGLLLQQRLGTAADVWAESGRRRDLLYTGRLLQSAEEVRVSGARIVPLRPVEREFVAAGVRRRSIWRRGVAAAVCLLLVVTGLAVYFGLDSRAAQRESESRETRLVAQQLAARADSLREADPQTAMRLSLAAYHTAETSESRSSLYASYMTLTPVDLPVPERSAVLALAYRPDGAVLAASHRAGKEGGQVQLWDLSRRGVPRMAHAIPTTGSASIAYQPGGTVLAVHSPTRLELWDTADPDEPQLLAGRQVPHEVAYTLAFSPDGRTLAAGGDSGRLRLWDASRPDAPEIRFDRDVADSALKSLAYSGSGAYLVTGNGVRPAKDGERPAQVRVWDTRDPLRPVLRDTAETKSLASVAFHPRRPLVATAGAAGLAYWVVEGGPAEARLRHVEQGKDSYGPQWDGTGNEIVSSMAFNKDGTLLAGAMSSGSRTLVRQVGPDDNETLYSGDATTDELTTSEEAQAVAYSPDGVVLAAGDVSGAIRLWPNRPAAPAVVGKLSMEQPGESVLSKDGRLLLTDTPALDPVQGSPTVRVWDVRKPSAPRVRFTVPRGWEANSFLPGDGATALLTHQWREGSDRHTFRFWVFGRSGAPKQGRPFHVEAQDLMTRTSTDGKLLAAGTSTGGVELWDVSDPLLPVRRSVSDMELSGDLFSTGRLWFTGDKALGTVANGVDIRLWDVSDPTRPRLSRTIEGAAADGGASYLYQSKILLTEEAGQYLRLWDMKDPAHPKKAGKIPGASAAGYPVGTDQIVTVLKDGNVHFWDVRDPRKPEVDEDRTLRIDQLPDDVRVTPDGKNVLTSNPYRLWDLDDDGRWSTPSTVTLEGASRVVVSNAVDGGQSYMAVEPKQPGPGGRSQTYVLPYDTDGIYEELCEGSPLSVDKKQWTSLFPHLMDKYRNACE
ncbi:MULTISPECIES: caspase family protein [unclassified Streptomyces]|uniref:caspase, EACC1-associated type n=1 Tax=unclassified Streptomyces TaxID=2593676 RepID=UPI00131C0FDB|nr:caspase family protein [Streptomyces sp. CB01635]